MAFPEEFPMELIEKCWVEFPVKLLEEHPEVLSVNLLLELLEKLPDIID